MTSSGEESDSEIKQSLLICKHCQSLIKDPKSLPCLHAYCTTCLQNLMQGKEMCNCPQCGVSTKLPPGGVTAFPVASHLIALAEYVQLYIHNDLSVPCVNKENEDGHQDAAVKCMECDVYYCNTCDSAHKLSIVCKRHTAIKMTDLKEEHFVKAAQRSVSSCEKHPNSSIEYYCLEQSCKTVMCQKCFIVSHQNHACVEVEKMAEECSATYIKSINEDIEKQQAELKKLQDEIQAAIRQNEGNHENNVKQIQETTEEMKKMLEEKETILLEEERKHTDDVRKYYAMVNEQVKDMSTSLKHVQALVQNMTSFSPDDELVKQHEEIQKKIDKALQESKSLELWIQSVPVTSQGQPLVESNQRVRKSKPMKCHDALDGYVNSLAVFEHMTVALHWYKSDRPTALYVRGKDESKGKAVKERIEKHCPKACKIVPMVKDEQEKMIIVSTKGKVGHDIKILSLDCDDVEDLGIDASHKPYAITVDDKNNVLYTNTAVPRAIRKKIGQQIETIFTNQIENETLHTPWDMTTNINGDIIVIDCGKKSLFIFNINGKLTNTYRDFTVGEGTTPSGVCTCPAGWIYVSDRNGDRIHRLDKTGTFKDYIVTKQDGLSAPTALQWHKGTLVVGQINGEIKYFKI